MEVKELRLGNLIEINNNVIVMDNRIFHAVIHGFEGYEPKPIPLTEEWILKFWFKKEDKTWRDKSVSKGLFFIGRYFVEHSKEDFLFCQLHYSGDAWFLKNIKYVHELQNLYFSLTDKELTLKNYEFVETERLHQHGIKCLTCGRTSYNPEDIKNLYCGFCNKFHNQII